MEFFKSNTRIRFMQQRKLAALFSAVIFLVSVYSLIVNHLNLGLDFTGGMQMTIVFEKTVSTKTIREELLSSGFKQASVVAYNSREFSVKVGPHTEMSREALKTKLLTAIPGAKMGGALDYIGPQVGKQLMTNGVLAIVVSLIATMIYIAVRFEYRFAVSAALALIHDPVLILGLFSWFHLEFNMIVLTAILTVIGYSLNDTIVVYDRVRENFHKVRKMNASDIMDLSINQTLSRTIMTSGLTLLVVIALFIYGGDMVHGFALALIIGIVIGTYSSIYVAGSLAIAFGLDRQSLLPKSRGYAVDGRP